jgi:tRNA dimethylallyltransferase
LPGPPAAERERVPRSAAPGGRSLAKPSGLSLLVILGPTGTGKSELALRVAHELQGEIVGCDALQVYRGFDVATAKPTAAERARVPHHLIDWLEPGTECSLADWVRAADRAIARIAARGRVPLVVGGTGLYLRGLLRGVVDAPPRDERLRRRLRAVAERHGPACLHAWLARLDPESAGRLAPADLQRVTRAIEVARAGGGSLSQRLRRDGTWQRPAERYRALKIGLDMERLELARRLDLRVERFFERGLEREVLELLQRGTPRDVNAFKAIGYREVLEARAAGGVSEATREAVKRNTRRYAKRQRTWFRSEPGVAWLDATRDPSSLAGEVVERWRRHREAGAC